MCDAGSYTVCEEDKIEIMTKLREKNQAFLDEVIRSGGGRGTNPTLMEETEVVSVGEDNYGK